MQRVVYHFSSALEIIRETGVLSGGLKDDTEIMADHQDVVVDAKLLDKMVHLAAYIGLPFTRGLQRIRKVLLWRKK